MSSPINILAVDDKPENLLALQTIFDDPGTRLICATSGAEALDILVDTDVAVILLDVMLPGMDGYETAKLIRGSRKTKHIPIIFISAVNTDEGHVFKGYESGAVDYLTKPVVPQILKSKVAVFAELHQQRMALQQKAGELERAYHQIRDQGEALRASEVRFRSAFEQSFQFMAILDPQGRVLELNSLAEQLCGGYRGTIKNQYLWDICWVGQNEENHRLKEVILRAAHGECINDEAKFTDVNGDIHYFFRAVAPVKDEAGKIVCITFQGHDISKRVQAEQEKRNLEQLLQQAQKMEALGALAGGIAHDFNNVLSVIIGNAELAGRSADPATEQYQHYKRINSAASKAKDLVSQILSFSRRAEIEKVVLNPAETLMESVKLLRSSIPSFIEINHDIDFNCGPIYADPTQFHQIIMNLCTNAFHAMEDSGGKLHVKLQKDTLIDKNEVVDFDGEPGEYVHLTIADTGSGIKESYLDRIFDPYFTTKEKGKGTGMGLAIVHGIVKGHGGGMSIDTREGAGTAFHIYLPLVEREHNKPEDVFDSLSYGNERILLVDDEELLLEMVKNMLEVIGYQVVAVNKSSEALNLFCETPEKFDLVITDQTMPEMVGTDLARKMLRVRPDIPIILCTGYSPNISRETVTAFGIKELAFKPLALDELSSLVRKTIDS